MGQCLNSALRNETFNLQRILGIPLIYTGCFPPYAQTNIKVRGIPHLAKNERDAPNFLHAALDKTACAPFFKERRIKLAKLTTLHRKSGVWGTRDLLTGEVSTR
jgi:hypothetical protein